MKLSIEKQPDSESDAWWIRNEFGKIQAVFVSPELAAWIVESADALARLRADQFDECLGRNIAMGIEFGDVLTEDCEIEI